VKQFMTISQAELVPFVANRIEADMFRAGRKVITAMKPSMIGAALMQDNPVPRADDFALIQCKPGFAPIVL